MVYNFFSLRRNFLQSRKRLRYDLLLYTIFFVPRAREREEKDNNKIVMTFKESGFWVSSEHQTG